MLSSVVGNNEKVQEFATKLGAVNLAAQLEREKTPMMREAILSALSSFLKAQNFPGKRQYIIELAGLDQLITWTCDSGEQETVISAKFGSGTWLRKIRIKLI